MVFAIVIVRGIARTVLVLALARLIEVFNFNLARNGNRRQEDPARVSLPGAASGREGLPGGA